MKGVDALGDCHDVQVVRTDMKETGWSQRYNWRAHVAIGDDLDAEYIRYTPSENVGEIDATRATEIHNTSSLSGKA